MRRFVSIIMLTAAALTLGACHSDQTEPSGPTANDLRQYPTYIDTFHSTTTTERLNAQMREGDYWH